MFVVWKQYLAAASGAVVREVRCEKCSTEYCYRLVRRAEGQGTSLYYLNNRGAERRAQQQAQRRLAKRLERDVDPVACPDCGWYQPDMVREIRRRSLRFLRTMAIAASALLLLLVACWLPVSTQGFQRDVELSDVIGLFVLSVPLAISALLAFVLRHLLLRRRDPNRAYPARPELMPGAPRAFKSGESARTGNVEPSPRAQDGVLSYEHVPPALEPGGWITVQLLGLQIPSRCCVCQEPTPEVMHVAKGNLVSVPLPMCRGCSSAYAWRRRRWILGGVALLGVPALLLTMLSREFDLAGQIVTALIAAAAGGVVGAIVANLVAAPVKLGRLDRANNTIRIRFKNPHYANSFLAGAFEPAPAPLVIPVPRYRGSSQSDP